MWLDNELSTADKRLLSAVSKYSIIHGVGIAFSLILGLATGLLLSKPVFCVKIFAVTELIVHLILSWYDTFQVANNQSGKKGGKLKSKILQMLKCLLWILSFSAVFHVVTILYGAPVVSLFNETFHFGLLMALLTALPGCCFCGTEVSSWLRITLGSGPQNLREKSAVTAACSTTIGAWLGAFPIPLDWDRPWQVWPISCICGALMGSAFGWFSVYCSTMPQLGPKKRV